MTAAFITLLLTALPAVAPHMVVLEPSSRNYFANQFGKDGVAGKPRPEYTPQGLNGNTKVCGREGGAGINYDTWNDSQGNPMPWISQSTYAIGEDIQIDILMTGKFLSLYKTNVRCNESTNHDTSSFLTDFYTSHHSTSFGSF
jgi:hypothetical protein